MRRNNQLECPNAAEHTEAPSGYLDYQAWATAMEKTHRQRKCAGCNLWAIWLPKEKQDEH